MPLIRVELFDYRVTPEASEKIIAAMTDALCEAVHPGLRDHTWVIVDGHDPKNWGVGGKPWPVAEMPPGPRNVRPETARTPSGSRGSEAASKHRAAPRNSA